MEPEDYKRPEEYTVEDEVWLVKYTRTMIERLMLLSSLALYKFSEGEEDWTEWQELAETLEMLLDEPVADIDSETEQRVRSRLEEFWARRYHNK
jgi:hypothetical protein